MLAHPRLISFPELLPAFLFDPLQLLNIGLVSFWFIYDLDCSDSVLEDQKLPFCCLDEDLVGVVAFQGPGNRLASRDEADNELLASEFGNKLWTVSFRYTLCILDLCRLILKRNTPQLAAAGIKSM